MGIFGFIAWSRVAGAGVGKLGGVGGPGKRGRSRGPGETWAVWGRGLGEDVGLGL